MAVPPQSSFQFQHITHPTTSSSYQDAPVKINATLSDSMIPSNNINGAGSKKQKTTPPCDRCRQRRIKCDRLEPTCSSCIKYKATCVRTAFPAGLPLSTVSVDAIGIASPRIRTSIGKRDRHLSEAEILDSCLRNVQSLQLNRLHRIEKFFDRLGIDETRLEEVTWITEQIKLQRENANGFHSEDMAYQPEQVAEKLGPRASVPWIKELLPLVQATKRSQEVSTSAHAYAKPPPVQPIGVGAAKQAVLSETEQFICPHPKPTPFPAQVPLSVMNKTMFELSVHDHTEYLGPIAGTRASSWNEEMRFPLPWLVPEPQVPESFLALPPLEHILDLIEWMVQSPMYIYFPILTKASILNALSTALPDVDASSLGSDTTAAGSNSHAEKYALPERITGRVSAVFLLNAIMALGAAYRSNAIKDSKTHILLMDPKAREEKPYDFQLFFDRGRALTVYILDQPRISSLQGLLLLMKCPAIPGIRNLYREQACAMALSLGLHRDCEPWTLCRSVIQLRRNIFWCCYVIDASHSLNAGCPERFPDDYISIGLPQLPSIYMGDDIGEIEAEKEVHRIGFLTEQAKLWRIVKKIRRCGQTSSKAVEGYCEASNVFRIIESDILSSTPSSASSSFGPASNGSTKRPAAASSQPSWAWRADSARRILDVELAQWQMELPSHLRFDFAFTRQDDPCPFLLRVNGLGAMLQVIFNEVLILLHHPFLILAESQNQQRRDQGSHAAGVRQPKSRSNIVSNKSPRSRRSSSTSRAPLFSSNITNGISQHDESVAKASRSLPPFLNSCTKAAEAITFLVDHLLRTTPEWLVCHNEADSALHIAERVHALNVTMGIDSNSPGTSLDGLGPATKAIGQQARCQLRKTRAFRRNIASLDQFTMSNGFRPEFLTKEWIERGSARERLMRSIRQMLIHKRGSHYYRFPRGPTTRQGSPEQSGSGYEPTEEEVIGGDHLEMRLAFLEQRIWIRYYNIRIKDGVESKNGNESWLEILNPYVVPIESDIDTEEDEPSNAYPLEQDDMTMSIYDAETTSSTYPCETGAQRRRTESGGSMSGADEPMDPPQSSSSALMELFSNPNPTGIVHFADIIGESAFYPSQQEFTNKKDFSKDYGAIEPGFDTPIYYVGQYAPQDVPLDSLDKIEPPMVLDGSPHGFQPEHQTRGFHVTSKAEHQQLQPSLNPQTRYPQSTFQQRQQRQDPNGTFPNFELHTPTVLGFDHTVPSPSYSAPESPNHATTEATMRVGLMTVSTSLSMQPQMAFEEGPYLNLLHQQFPNQHVPTQPHGTASMQPLQQQSLESNLGTTQPSMRPFYGMPMGGFMEPSLESLPEVSRNANVQRMDQQSSYLTPTSPTGHQSSAGSAGSWRLEGQSTSGASKSGPISPGLPPSLASSVPTSPLPQSPFQMMLSPASEALQGISNRLNTWDGLGGSKADSVDISPQQQQQQQHQTQRSQEQSLMDFPSHFGNTWSSAPSTSELLANSSTRGAIIQSEITSTASFLSSFPSH